MTELKAFSDLLQTIKKLRDPQTGCPWDLKQDHKSLLKYLIEESYEFIDAVERDNAVDMEEEIGDVLLQVLLHAQIGNEKQSFNIESIAQKLNEKMIKRHPHVFNPSESSQSLQDIEKNWQKIKEAEKKANGKQNRYLSRKDLCSPALKSAEQIGIKTAAIHFDWQNPQEVWLKVQEEQQELAHELTNNSFKTNERIQEELGDLLFTLAQLARHLNVDPEVCLKQANEKFIKRFEYIESQSTNFTQLKKMNRAEKEKLWQIAKDINNEKTK